MRLIDANEALRAIENSREDNPFLNGKTTPVWEVAHDCAISSVLACPTIEAEPLKHGRWVELTECSNEGAYCSECHKKVYKADYALCVKKNKVRSNYCPNCGAKMDLEG